MRAMRAFALAVAIALPWLDDLNEMLERLKRPTAITVRRIMSERVTIKAKPLGGLLKVRMFI
jgi:hypothetical protein